MGSGRRVLGRLLIGSALLIGVSGATIAVAATDLLAAYEAAKTNDPKYRVARGEYDAALQQAKQLRSGALPQVNLEYQQTDTEQTVVSSDNTVFQQGSASYGTENLVLRASQPLFRWDRFLGWKQSRLQEKQAEARLLIAAQDLQVRVAETYFNALAARDAVILSRAQLASAKRQYEDADARYRRGLARRTDQLDAQARQAQVEAELLTNQNAWEDALEALRELMGTSPGEIVPVSRELQLAPPSPLDIDQWVTTARDGNVDLQAQRLAVHVAEREAQRSKAGHYPTLDLQLSHTENATDGSLFGGGSETESDDVTLAFNLPIYAGGSVAAKRKESAARREQSKDELMRLDRAVERQARAAFQGILSAIRRAEALSQSVKAQELAVETKQKGFGSGLYTSMTVLDAEEDLYADRRQYAQSRYDYLISWVKLRRAAGQLAETDMVALNRQLVGGNRTEPAAGQTPDVAPQAATYAAPPATAPASTEPIDEAGNAGSAPVAE